MRVRWIGVTAAAGIGAVGVGVALYARYIEPSRPQLDRISFRLPAGHEGLDGMKIAFVTDVHHGPFTSLLDIERGLDLLRREKPDLLLLGGDYHSDSPRYLAGIAGTLGAFAREFPLGVLGVMGNHDYANSGHRTYDVMLRAGVRLLQNEAVPVSFNGGTLWVAGSDDSLLGFPDLDVSFANVPSGAAVLSLWHPPIRAGEAAARGAFGQLSGHTHGGQVRLPIVGALALPRHGRRHIMGFSNANGMPVYTSRGLGMYRPPVRLNCPPEVTLVTLRAGGDPI